MNTFPPNIVNLLYTYGYYVLFLLVVIEGPVVTILSGILSSLGFFNFWITFMVVVVGDLVGDVLYYSAGRWLLTSFVNKKYERLERVFKNHQGKILFFSKLSSFIGPTAMLVAGALKSKFSRFMYLNFIGSVFKTLLLVLIGFYFGGALSRFGKDLNLFASLGLVALAILIAGIYLLVTKIAGKYYKNLEKS